MRLLRLPRIPRLAVAVALERHLRARQASQNAYPDQCLHPGGVKARRPCQLAQAARPLALALRRFVITRPGAQRRQLCALFCPQRRPRRKLLRLACSPAHSEVRCRCLQSTLVAYCGCRAFRLLLLIQLVSTPQVQLQQLQARLAKLTPPWEQTRWRWRSTCCGRPAGQKRLRPFNCAALPHRVMHRQAAVQAETPLSFCGPLELLALLPLCGFHWP